MPFQKMVKRVLKLQKKNNAHIMKTNLTKYLVFNELTD